MCYKNLSGISWEDLQSLSLVERGKYFNQEGGLPYHTLIAQQFNRTNLDLLCNLTTKVRHICKTKQGVSFMKDLGCGKRAIIYFDQPSTRTRLSFEAACDILGIDRSLVDNPAETSSEKKGESKLDTMRTFSSYGNMIIMRTIQQGLAEQTAWHLAQTRRPVPVFNGGSGKDQHPTQMLLDVYTFKRSMEKVGGLTSKTIVFVGDLKRGRTVRSLAWALTNYTPIKLVFCALDRFQILPDVLEWLDAAPGVEYELTSNFTQAIREADGLYMTRMQDEHDESGESKGVDTFNLTPDNVNTMKPTAVIHHPLPRRDEIHTAIDTDPRAMQWRGVRNGQWMRVADIATVFGWHTDIEDYWRKNHI